MEHSMNAALRVTLSGVAVALSALHAGAQKPVPIRNVTAPLATDSGIFRRIASIRALSDGRVIVNDDVRRRLLMFDSTLRSFTTLADTSAAAPARYPTARQAGIFAFIGDSTIFVDTEAQALVVVDPSGNFGRVMAPPKASDLPWLATSAYGTPGFDAKGRLVYRGIRRDAVQTFYDFQVGGPTRVIPAKPDSGPI